MAFTIKYHLLFEVRIIHGFYLKDEVDFYAGTEAEKADALLKERYNILDAIEILPTPDCQRLMKGHRLRFKPTSLGFMVGVETDSDTKPSIEISPNTDFTFMIRLKKSDWINYTNQRLQPEFFANYYFNNFRQEVDYQENSSGKFLNLSIKHTNLNTERRYEMGEISLGDNDDLIRAKLKTNGDSNLTDTTIWEVIDDLKNVNANDRQLLPSRFDFRLVPNKDVEINSIDFELQKLDNTPVENISIADVGGRQSISLDFRSTEEERKVNLPPDFYRLIATSPDGYSENRIIYIDDLLYNRQNWAVIQIGHRTGLGKYRILEDDGSLRTENGTIKHPVFELRVKNRATYWRYKLHPANQLTSFVFPDFDASANQVITKNTFPLSKFNNDNIPELDSQKLPNPNDLTLQMNTEKTKFYTDIYLPRIDL